MLLHMILYMAAKRGHSLPRTEGVWDLSITASVMYVSLAIIIITVRRSYRINRRSIANKTIRQGQLPIQTYTARELEYSAT